MERSQTSVQSAKFDAVVIAISARDGPTVSLVDQFDLVGRNDVSVDRDEAFEFLTPILDHS